MNVIWLEKPLTVEEVAVGTLDSPWGTVFTAWHGEALSQLGFADSPGRRDEQAALVKRAWKEAPEWLGAADPRLQQLRGLLEHWPDVGDRRLPTLEMIGSGFQQDVWRILLRLKVGQTVTYGDIASRLGNPGAARAVGRAVGANPVSVLVPCHRVLPSGGGTGHYTGGAERKRALLRTEGIIG